MQKRVYAYGFGAILAALVLTGAACPISQQEEEPVAEPVMEAPDNGAAGGTVPAGTPEEDQPSPSEQPYY